MRAIGYQSPGDPDVLEDVELPDPQASGRDLLVEVRAISVNPVDTKQRRAAGPAEGSTYKVIGWDVAGVVREVGPEVEGFGVGDEVWYAGSLVRPGGNAELHLVDERIVSLKPTSLDMGQAAAMPLTTITAWEMLFERFGVPRDGGSGRTLLVVGAGGGVGSILVQLAATLTDLRVVGTASRPETTEWVRSLGAHDVVDHSRPLAPQLAEIGVQGVDLVACLTHTGEHYEQLVEVLAPQGALCVIDDPGTLDASPLKQKSGTLHWEFMFTRSMFETPDLAEQGRLLGEVAGLVDAGSIRTTTPGEGGDVFGTIDAATLRRAHEHLESHTAVGKVVLAGWDR